MPFQRAQYPAQWPTLAHAAKVAAGWRCAGCGVPHGALAVSTCNCLYRVVLAACGTSSWHITRAPRPQLTTFASSRGCASRSELQLLGHEHELPDGKDAGE